MNGMGILRGMGVTIKHFIETYTQDLKTKDRYNTPSGIELRSKSTTSGIFTVQYPEEKIPVPEEFRFIPFLVYDEDPDGEKNLRCTSCGICAKVCPLGALEVVHEK